METPPTAQRKKELELLWEVDWSLSQCINEFPHCDWGKFLIVFYIYALSTISEYLTFLGETEWGPGKGTTWGFHRSAE